MPQTHSTVSRRAVLTTTAAVVGGLTFGGLPQLRAAQDRRRTLRVVHLTDWHLMDQRNARAGIAAALEHAVAQKPDILLNGGDMMTHTMARPIEEARADMRFWVDLLGQVDRSILQLHSIGNHDIWGWNRPRSRASGDEPEFGKQWWTKHFGEGRAYRATSVGGWKFVMLDSIRPEGDGYFTALDDEQFEWLERELSDTPESTPVLLLIHAPILAIATFLRDARIDPRVGYQLGRGHICMDAARIVELCSRHPNVRLALSGHKHMLDRVEFQGMTHICGGAVCGNWWRPSEIRRPALAGDPPGLPRPFHVALGYGLLDLHPDGRFDYRYVRYPWEFVD